MYMYVNTISMCVCVLVCMYIIHNIVYVQVRKYNFNVCVCWRVYILYIIYVHT